MFTKAAVLLALAATAIGQSSNAPTINTPTGLTQCQPVQLAWSGGSGEPYYISVLPGSNPSGTPLKDFGAQTGNTLTWTPQLAVGTSVTLKVVDSMGAMNYAQAVSIAAGPSTSCLDSTSGGSSNSTSSTGSSSSGSSSSAAGSTSSSSSAAANAGSTGSKSSGSSGTSATGAGSSAASGTAAAASASKTGAASPVLGLNGGLIVAAAGVVGAALF